MSRPVQSCRVEITEDYVTITFCNFRSWNGEDHIEIRYKEAIDIRNLIQRFLVAKFFKPKTILLHTSHCSIERRFPLASKDECINISCPSRCFWLYYTEMLVLNDMLKTL